MSRLCSKRATRSRSDTPIAANCCAPPPIAHCSTNRPPGDDASVPSCSAAMTGCHNGSSMSTPAGLSPHSASIRPRIGVFW